MKLFPISKIANITHFKLFLKNKYLQCPECDRNKLLEYTDLNSLGGNDLQVIGTFVNSIPQMAPAGSIEAE